jgi:hypothetical protein
MNDLIVFLSEENYFTEIYFKSDYHQIIICEGDEWKTTFKTK